MENIIKNENEFYTELLCPKCGEKLQYDAHAGSMGCRTDGVYFDGGEEIAPSLVQMFRIMNNNFTVIQVGDVKKLVLKDDRPEWVRDIVYAAHDGSMPSDPIYEICDKVAGDVSELDSDADEDEIRDAIGEIEADVYTSDLLNWLASSTNHLDYVDQALEEFDTPESGSQLIALAQSLQIQEIGGLMLDEVIAIRERMVDELDELIAAVAEESE